jgi:monoamine oxidase
VGAGYAGLTAAHRLTQAGKTVAVLEARDRVGGRVWTDALSDGTPVDRGGGWMAPKHDAIRGLITELGIGSYKTYVKGAHLLTGDGQLRRYTGLIPKISPLAVLTIARAQMRIDRMAKTLDVEAPWTAKRAGEWDNTSVSDWVESCKIRSDIGHDLFETAVRGLMTGNLSEVSLLHLIFLVRSAGSINTLFSITGGYQENLFDGGAGAAARLIADKLGDAVRLGAPVRRISQTNDRVTIEAGDLTVEARNAIVATPPALTLEIDFQPGLPDDRRALYTGAVAGPETKTLVVYDEPFWRSDGFSGQSAEPNSVSEVTLDASPMSGTPGVIASFTFGPNAERVDAMDGAERRRLVVEALTKRFGPKAASPRDFVETAWWQEEWTRGCSMAHYPLGVLTKYGHLLRAPMGRIHWAGTETATVSHGAIDGAVRSGERAANEICALA